MRLLEFLQWVLNCEFLSDLRFEPYRSKAIILFKKLDLRNCSRQEIEDTKEYFELI